MTSMKTYLSTPTTFGVRNTQDLYKGHFGKYQDAVKCRPAKPSKLVQKKPPETDEDYLELYQDRILNAQKRQLFPLQEDLAEWLNKTLGIEDITGDNFMDALDNGVILCQLARVIRERAQRLVDKGFYNGRVPQLNGHCFQNAARRSFFSRDNMENFIVFCKELGVHQNLLFESDDLVLHNQPRNVILCLLELSRITTKFNIEPPGLVELEKEIEEEEQRTEEYNQDKKSPTLSWQFRPSFHNLSRSTSEGSSMSETMWSKPMEGSDGVPSDHTEDDWSRESADETDVEVDSGLIMEVASPMNELDRKVQQTTKIVQKHCCCTSPSKCSKLSVKKVGDGKYNIAGRNVFVRLLKGRHMMVRVGGGWDTLEHFLLRHDPCQVRIMNRGASPSSMTPTKQQNIFNMAAFGSLNNLQMLTHVPAAAGSNAFLHIRAKYRKQPPPLS